MVKQWIEKHSVEVSILLSLGACLLVGVLFEPYLSTYFETMYRRMMFTRVIVVLGACLLIFAASVIQYMVGISG